MMIIFLLNPLVSGLEHRGIRRVLGTLGIYILFISVVVVAGLLLAPPLGRQAKELGERIPQIRESAVASVEQIASRFNVSTEELGLDRLSGNPPEPGTNSGDSTESSPASGNALEGLGGLFRGFSRFATGALHVALVFVLAPFVALYLLIDLPKIQRSIIYYIPPHHREEWLGLARKCGQAVGGFFRGQLLVAMIVGFMSSAAFYFLDLPFWLPMGLLAGFFNIIPLVGPFVGGGLAVIVGALTVGPSLALKAALAMLIVQQIDNHFISPKVMGRAVRLHPVAVMMALLLGGTLAGFWGVLLGVPALAVIKIIALHFYETRVLGITDPAAAAAHLAGTQEAVFDPLQASAGRLSGAVPSSNPEDTATHTSKRVAVATRNTADQPGSAPGKGQEVGGFPPISSLLEEEPSRSPEVESGASASDGKPSKKWIGGKQRAADLLSAALKRRRR